MDKRVGTLTICRKQNAEIRQAAAVFEEGGVKLRQFSPVGTVQSTRKFANGDLATKGSGEIGRHIVPRPIILMNDLQVEASDPILGPLICSFEEANMAPSAADEVPVVRIVEVRD